MELRSASLRAAQSCAFTGNMLDDAVKHYKKESKGSDSWGPSEIRALPLECKNHIAFSIQEASQKLAWPHQLLISLNPCLGKPKGDCRTVCKTPMLYRMWCRANKSVKEWEQNNTQPYDTATIGSSALTAALCRNLQMEVASLLGFHSAAIFDDYEKFFDTMDVPILIQEAAAVKYPLDTLSISMQQHLAPRVIQANGFSSRPICVCRSILAGCKFSKAKTQVYLQRRMVKLNAKHKSANFKLYVDDTSKIAFDMDMDRVIGTLVNASVDFGHMVRKLKLSLSPKAVLTASSFKLAKLLKKELATYGLTYSIEQAARDLGITNTAAQRRPNKLLKNRFTKRKNKITRISKLARISRKAKKLFSGSAFASTTWGHQACGLSSSEVISLERDALSCTGIKPAGRCRAISLAISFGILGTPRARIVRETIRSWFDVLSQSKDQFSDIRVAWSIAVEELSVASTVVSQALAENEAFLCKNASFSLRRCANVPAKPKGIMSNLISILVAAGWQPTLFNCWTDESGDRWVLTDFSVSSDVVANAIIKAFFSKELVRAATHYNGKGIQDGIDFHNSMFIPRTLKDTQYPLKCALETVLGAGAWPEARINSIHPSHSPACTRCGCPLDDALHSFWTCPANSSIEEPSVVDSQNLIDEAVANADEFPCMWLRGILPAKFTYIDPLYNPTQYLKMKYTNKTDTDIVWGSGTYYGDSSGGLFTAHTALRRVGCGLAKVDHNGSLLFGARCNLPGEVQTVPRGELFILVVLVGLAAPLSEIDYVTDNEGLYKLFNAGPKVAFLSSNCDLYKILFDVIYKNMLLVSVRWMPSHLLEKPDKGVYSCMSNLDILGNARADTLAGEAAAEAQLPKYVTTEYLHYANLIKRIQLRLATIITCLPNRTKPRKQKGEAVLSLSQAYLNSKHTLVSSEHRVTCVKCTMSFKTSDPHLREWLKLSCEDLSTDFSRPSRPSRVDISIHHGNNNTHYSHSLCTYRGLLYCNVCGSRGGKWGFQHLSRQCVPPTQYGLASLKAIRDGRLPPNLPEWPEDEGLIDRPLCQQSKPSKSFQGLRIKRPVSIFSTPAAEEVRASPLPTVPSTPSTNVILVLPDYLKNIQDLIDLHNAGEPVIWPAGLSALTASTAISDYLRNQGTFQEEDTSITPSPPVED